MNKTELTSCEVYIFDLCTRRSNNSICGSERCLGYLFPLLCGTIKNYSENKSCRGVHFVTAPFFVISVYFRFTRRFLCPINYSFVPNTYFIIDFVSGITSNNTIAILIACPISSDGLNFTLCFIWHLLCLWLRWMLEI
jgi:hypothetical protein